MSRRIAEFDESDDALRFAKMKGEDFTVCAGIDRPWAVRTKDVRAFNYNGETPPDYYYVDPDREDDHE